MFDYDYLLTSRFRCDHITNKSKCICEDLLKKATQKLKDKLAQIQNFINNSQNFTSSKDFEDKLKHVEYEIQILKKNVALEQHNLVDNGLPEMIEYVKQIHKKVTSLINKIPNNISIQEIQNLLTDVERIFKMCKQKITEANGFSNSILDHNDEITKIAKEARIIYHYVTNLLKQIPQVVNSYNNAKLALSNLHGKIDNIRILYTKTKSRITGVKERSEKLYKKARNVKEQALKNQKQLKSIVLPLYNNTSIYCGDVPLFNNDFEKKMMDQFNDTKKNQQALDKMHSEMKDHNRKAVHAEEENVKDVKFVENVYDRYLKLIDKLNSTIATKISDILNLEDGNESDLKLLENKLKGLIHKLNSFLQQSVEFGKLNDINKKYFEVSKIE